MPPAKNLKRAGWYAGIIRAISTPLGFYVLSLLIVEATIGLILTASKLTEEHVWLGFFVAVGLFLMVFGVVSFLVIWNPRNLLYDWKEAVTDLDEKRVFSALDGPQYTWRTVGGVARHAGLPQERVAQILNKYDLMLTRFSETPSITGSALVGLIEKVGA